MGGWEDGRMEDGRMGGWEGGDLNVYAVARNGVVDATRRTCPQELAAVGQPLLSLYHRRDLRVCSMLQFVKFKKLHQV